MAPANRSGGTSERAENRPENSRVSPLEEVSEQIAALLGERFEGARHASGELRREEDQVVTRAVDLEVRMELAARRRSLIAAGGEATHSIGQQGIAASLRFSQ